ncbi:hypothetical protein FOL47_006709 [Perkinsus chesapeaki]|uniref:Uncharacterized protein n=1 Tax=Perkinsus chesapeaki TaxID=330153 RepID=A0A7J6MZ14_PERCH|nr:hypothetical protein FOL47_006709 [Perkinsus chesapeaki]
MTHDSATGYLNASLDFFTKMAKTQVGGFAKQLGCGARAFDLRPECHPNRQGDLKLTMHHAEMEIKYPLKTALQDIISWANANPSELILVGLSHYSPNNTDCREAVWQLTEELGLMKSIGSGSCPSCGAVTDMSVGEAKKASAIDGGGHVFVIEADDNACVAENYVPAITCYNESSFAGNKPDDFGVCYPSDAKGGYSEYANKQLFDYIQKMAASTAERNNSKLQMNQAHWQYSIPLYTGVDAKHSSIIMDEYFSEVNKRVVDLVGDMEFLNLLEVDNVCNYGPQLQDAVNSRIGRLTSTAAEEDHRALRH